jgi:hypothetical protein
MRRAFVLVILSAAKDLIAASHRWGNGHEVLHFVQDDREELL